MSEGLKNLEGNLKLYKKLLRKFFNDNQDATIQIKSALAQNDRAQARLSKIYNKIMNNQLAKQKIMIVDGAPANIAIIPFPLFLLF